ncbi:unnamed protein product [Mucor hiemalis]
MLVKQHLPQSLAEAQTTAIRECEEESESEEEDSSDEDSEEEVVIVKKKPAKKIEKKKQTSTKEKNVKEDKNTMDNKALDDLTKSFQKFSLFVENGGLEQMEMVRKKWHPNSLLPGLNALIAKIGICRGAKGPHSFWKRPD